MKTNSRAVTAFELNALGIEVMRANLRRRHPEETDAGIEARLAAWMVSRPHAPSGDADGTPAKRFD